MTTTTSSSIANDGEGRTRVRIRANVYDLFDANRFAYPCGVGVFHSGIDVFGREYAYGGHPASSSGIFCTPRFKAPGKVKFRQTLDLGYTDLTLEEVQSLARRMGRKYTGTSYHLLMRNCNHFADEFVFVLTGGRARLPSWVNRLAKIAVQLQWVLPKCLLPEVETVSVYNKTHPQQYDRDDTSVDGEKQWLLANRPQAIAPNKV